MPDIFLSYASENRDTASRFAESFERRGWDVWWDREIKTGKPFDQEIAVALAAAKCVVVLWSEHSTQSFWVKDEAGTARDRDVLAPILIEDVEIPLGFRQIQAALLVDWDGDESLPAFKKLIDDIGHIVGSEAAVLEVETPFQVKPVIASLAAVIAVIAVVLIGLDPLGFRRSSSGAQVCVSPGPGTWQLLPESDAPVPATRVGLELFAGADTVLFEDHRLRMVFVGTSESSEEIRSSCQTALQDAWISLMPEEQQATGNTRVNNWINNAEFAPQISLLEGDTLSARVFTYTTNPRERISTFVRKQIVIRNDSEVVTLIL